MVGVNSPASTARFTDSDGTSPTYDFPARSARTLDPSMSMPMTGIPASAYSIASGSPTYPKPTIAAVKFFGLMRDSRPFSLRVPAIFRDPSLGAS